MPADKPTYDPILDQAMSVARAILESPTVPTLSAFSAALENLHDAAHQYHVAMEAIYTVQDLMLADCHRKRLALKDRLVVIRGNAHD